MTVTQVLGHARKLSMEDISCHWKKVYLQCNLLTLPKKKNYLFTFLIEYSTAFSSAYAPQNFPLGQSLKSSQSQIL